jgi:hypothetical protein
MRTDEAPEQGLLDLTVRFPEHVIFRSFAHETVALNLQTGQFHGLNLTAGRMVELMGRDGRPRSAVEPITEEYGIPREQVERDVAALLNVLLERGLVELDV